MNLSKTDLRQQMKAARARLSPEEVAAYGERIGEVLWAWANERGIRTVHSYLPLAQEVDPLPFLRKAWAAGWIIICPKTLENRQLENRVLPHEQAVEWGKFRTRHPDASCDTYQGPFDLILVPGLAFDAQGGRLGYGAGYYDAFLAQHPKALKIGLAYPFQLLPQVPTEPHDCPLNGILWAEDHQPHI